MPKNEITDKRETGQKIDLQFSGKLYDVQKGVLKALW